LNSDPLEGLKGLVSYCSVWVCNKFTFADIESQTHLASILQCCTRNLNGWPRVMCSPQGVKNSSDPRELKPLMILSSHTAVYEVQGDLVHKCDRRTDTQNRR